MNINPEQAERKKITPKGVIRFFLLLLPVAIVLIAFIHFNKTDILTSCELMKFNRFMIQIKLYKPL
jgi:hypothetical protein